MRFMTSRKRASRLRLALVGCGDFTDYEEMLARVEMDAVYLVALLALIPLLLIQVEHPDSLSTHISEEAA
jgi:hypothetical protein